MASPARAKNRTAFGRKSFAILYHNSLIELPGSKLKHLGKIYSKIPKLTSINLGTIDHHFGESIIMGLMKSHYDVIIKNHFKKIFKISLLKN